MLVDDADAGLASRARTAGRVHANQSSLLIVLSSEYAPPPLDQINQRHRKNRIEYSEPPAVQKKPLDDA